MGLFSFLFGDKKPKAKAAPKPAAENPAKPEKPSASAAIKSTESPAPVVISQGILQAKLRLKLVASLRNGKSAAAYEAAKSLADIQVRAGRKTVARVWQRQADQIKAELSA
jgi:hypothetical protein